MATKCAATWQATQMLIDIGRSMFSSGACNDIVQSNDFTNLEEYFMQKEFIKSLGNYRNVQKFCPDEIVSFILSWLKFNDNRRNAYSDAMYKANLIDALSETISPSTTIVTSPDMLTPGAFCVDLNLWFSLRLRQRYQVPANKSCTFLSIF